MGKTFFGLTLLTATCAAGCSSISVPSVPSMPWSHSVAKADPGEEALFAEGNNYFKDKRYARAIDAYTRLKADHPFSPLITEAELKTADAYYLNKQYPEAINAFKEFQSLHPSNENIPFVVLRLGEAHFDQFTATDREQKNTEIAKGFFETVVTQYPQSPYAAEAKEKLVKCIEYLAEHDFDVASFYFKQEKYPAARDRFEEIVRKYRGTPAAAKSLFFLGESYRNEKNNIKAGLAYEALIEHYPQSKYAPEAKAQLAQIDKEKQDPLAMLLMRDRRPGAPEATQQVAENKTKDIPNLVAKTDFVYEEPGDEKTFLRRVADKINPFSPSDDNKKKPESKPESGIAILAKRAPEPQQTASAKPSFWSSINPFASKPAPAPAKDNSIVTQVDNSLKQKGIDSDSQIASLKSPSTDFQPVPDTPRQPTMDTGKLLGDVDATLKKSGREVTDLPPPAAAEVFSDPVAIQAVAAKATPKQETPQSTVDSGLLSAIDQKLKSQGVQAGTFETPPPVPDASQVASATPKKVELQPKLAVEKGPLFLNPAEVTASPEKGAAPAEKPDVSGSKEAQTKDTPAPTSQDPAVKDIPRNLVKGPTQTQPAPTRTADQRKSVTSGDDETKNVMDYLKQDIEGIGKVLNPLKW